MTKNTLKGYSFAALSAVIYGTMPLMAKHIYADGVNAMTLVFLRNILALPSLAPLALLKQKTLRISPRELGSVCLISLFGCCGTSVLPGSALVVAASVCIAVSDMRKKEAVSCPKNVI